MCGYVPLGVFFDHAIFYHYQEACSHQLVYGGQGIRRVCRFCTSLLGPRIFFFFCCQECWSCSAYVQL